MRLTLPFVVAGLTLAIAPAGAQDRDHRVILRDVVRTYQGRNNGPEQTERFSRKAKVGRDGRISITNIAGDITVTVGSGDEVSIDAVKRTRGDKSELAAVQIVVDERPGRVDVRTEGEQNRSDRNRRSTHVSVDYTISMPATASIDLHSISGALKITGVRGAVRAETISGNVTATDTPKVEVARSISGDVLLTGAAADGDLSGGSVSGTLTARGLKARGLDLGSISGDIILSDVTCERLGIKSVSGSVEYTGAVAKGARYEINSHSGSVRLHLSNPAGFELTANSFSGTIRSEFPVTLGPTSSRNDGGRPGPGRSTHAVFGDGSATLTIRTFSGDIVIAKR